MKEIQYEGDISKDLTNINKEFNYKKGMKTNIIVTIILAVGLINIGFAANFSIEFIITYVLSLIYSFSCGISVIHKNKKYFNKEKEKSINNIKELKYKLSKENIDLSLDNFKDYVEEEINLTSQIKDDEDNIYQIIEQEINKFYLLDKNEQLQVLKRVKETINNDSTNKLYLYEDEDKELEFINIVRKRI